MINENPAEPTTIENDMVTADDAVAGNAVTPQNDAVTENDMAIENNNVTVKDMFAKKKQERDRARNPPPVELMRQSHVAARVAYRLPRRHQMTDEQSDQAVDGRQRH